MENVLDAEAVYESELRITVRDPEDPFSNHTHLIGGQKRVRHESRLTDECYALRMRTDVSQ